MKFGFLGRRLHYKNKSKDVMLTNEAKTKIDNELVLSEVINLVPSYVFWKNKQLVFLGCNLQFAQQFGCNNVDEIIGKTDDDFPWAENEFKEKYNRDDLYVIQTGESLLNIEEEQIQLDGSIRTLLVSKVPLKNHSGAIVGILGTYVDISYLKNIERSLRASKELAESANSAKTEFLANMSHDVKTPMSGIMGVADLMIHNPSWRTSEKAEMIHSAGEQVLNFFNHCLELSKLEMAEWESKEELFSLQSLLDEIYALFMPQAQTKGLNFTIDFDEDLPKSVLGYRASLYRVILNLVGNALKFTEKGEIHLRAFLADKISEKSILVGIGVKDTGIGIAEDKQTIIFEKLRRLTPSYEGKIEGSGIGLYIVDQYVKRMGGTINIDSAPGQGSTFTVVLPMTISSQISTNSNTSSQYREIHVEKTSRILLIEDNPVVQLVTKNLLNDIGFEVDVAGTGAEAITAFSPGKYGLIYMDIGLPDIDGYAVTKAIREKEKLFHAAMTPIVALTGHAALDVQSFCGEVGMQGVISKPIQRHQIEGIWQRYGQGESLSVDGLTVL